MLSFSLERLVEAPDALDVRGGNAWRAKFELGEGYMVALLMSAGRARWTGTVSDGGEGFTSSPAMGISPEVGVFDAEDSLEGEDNESPRSRL